jgi:hypothetical protein
MGVLQATGGPLLEFLGRSEAVSPAYSNDIFGDFRLVEQISTTASDPALSDAVLRRTSEAGSFGMDARTDSERPGRWQAEKMQKTQLREHS